MPGVGILMRGAGLFGSLSAGREVFRIGKMALPRAEYASEVERLVAALEMEAIALRSQPEADPGHVAAVRAAVAALGTAIKAGEDTDASTASSHGQDNNIREVSKAMQDLDRITQTNAGAAEETAAAVNRLNAMVADLEMQLTFFRHGDGSLNSGVGLVRPQPTSSWAEGNSEDRRAEPHVGASVPSVTQAASFAAQ